MLTFNPVNLMILSQAAKLNSVNTHVYIFIMYCRYVLYVVCCSNGCTMFTLLPKTIVNAAAVVLNFHFSTNLSALVLIIFGKSVWNNISNATVSTWLYLFVDK